MAIARKPNSGTNPSMAQQGERAAEAFIASVDAKQPAAPRAENKIPIMLRFDPTLLHKVDGAARRRGISRSAWVQYVISRALDSGEG